MPVNTSITIRKGSSAEWVSVNPVLASGEPAYDLTNNVLKVGDGVTPWNSLANHKHSSSDITNFNSSVSGLLPTISNSGDNRILTSTGSSVGINAESNLTFDGSLLNIIGSGNFNNVFISGVPISEIIDDEVAGLLVAGSGISLNYNDSNNALTVSTSTNIINSSNLYLWASFR